MNRPNNDGRGDGIIKVKTAAEREEHPKRLCKITGTITETGTERILSYVAGSQIWNRTATDEHKILAAVDLIAEYRPTNLTEATLAVQMFAVHEAALYFLQSATQAEQTFEGRDANMLRATRLMRLFNEQVELMAKLKGKTSQQKVTVEHVHVHQGGQAIVGAVNNGTDRGEGNR